LRVVAPSKKKPNRRTDQKKHFLCNDPLKNFEFDIFHLKKNCGEKFYNGLHKKYKEKLV
jgi:predicted metal-dependent hydrolase